MANSSAYTDSGIDSLLNRGYQTTPDYTAQTKFGIGTGTTTVSTVNTALETQITSWSGAADYKSYVSGYPLFDEANEKVTVQGFIGSTEANGNVITEYADFNTDVAPIMSSHIVFTGITKTSSVQVYLTTEITRS